MPWIVFALLAATAFEQGKRRFEAGDMPGAREALDEAIAENPAHAEAYLYRAMVAQEDHGLAGAQADYETAVKLSPDLKEAHRYFGEALEEAGNIAAAEACYRRALELNPNYPDAVYLLGRLHHRRGDLEAARELLERHVQLRPAGGAHHLLGQIHLQRGEDDAALQAFSKDVEVAPDCQESRLALAELLARRRDWAAAARELRASLGFHPDDPVALRSLGRAFLELGEYERALAAFADATEASPGDADAEMAMASARWKLRWRYGWPFAAATAGSLLLSGILLAKRRRTT